MSFRYPINCTSSGCDHLAKYKIAARWTDGRTEELKTYALSCESCLRDEFCLSLEKQKRCRTSQGEILEPPGIIELFSGERESGRQRLRDLEQKILSEL